MSNFKQNIDSELRIVQCDKCIRGGFLINA